MIAGFKSLQLCGTIFESSIRYQNIKPIAIGSFGVVWYAPTDDVAADDRLTNTIVAVKKLSNPFKTTRAAKRAYRELALLRYLQHENLVALLDVYISPLENIYLVTELMEYNLRSLMKFSPPEDRLAYYIFYQIMRGLKFIHSAGVIHRDLKPDNLLVDNTTLDLKICDFGLARVESHDMTEHVATRYYRAPEIIIGGNSYSNKIDIWSAGSILVEMLERKPLFGGADSVDQYCKMTQLLGTPGEDWLEEIDTATPTRNFISSLPYERGVEFKDRFHRPCDHYVSMLEQLLCYDAKKRVSATIALKHPLLSAYHDETDEPISAIPINWVIDDDKISIDEWKLIVFSEILDFHRPWENP